MTRAWIYSVAGVAFAAAWVMAVITIFVPPTTLSWLTYDVRTPTTHARRVLGLHTACNIIDNHTTCQPFPSRADCTGDDRYFCSMWRSIGFMMSFSAVFGLATLVTFVVVLAGGKQKRDKGWKIVCYMLLIVGSLQCASMSLVSWLYEKDDRFFLGWTLAPCFDLSAASWVISFLSAFGILAAALTLPDEGGYELIPSERHGLLGER